MNRFPTLAIVVPHTHWDREWYRTRHEFQLMLVQAVDRLLEELERDSELSFFLLDGQTVILEDYLELRPDSEQRLRDQVSAGRIAIGPWYVLADEFLVGAESHARNLLVGNQVARRFGEPMRVGYIPDAFGHIAQMPQLLRRAGIDSAVFTRGMGDEIDALGWEHRWRAPDESEVLALNQCNGYCAAGALGVETDAQAWGDRPIDVVRAVAKVAALLDKMRPLANGSVVQVSNGCDHLPPQRELTEILVALREAMPETEFRVGGLDELMTAIRDSGAATKVNAGELLGGKYQFLLSGVWSTRVYLKQLNERCETLLSHVIEPLACYRQFLGGGPYPSRELARLWTTLLQNHAHDSICGCSIDEVHREMVSRFESVLAGGYELIRQLLIPIASAQRPAGDGDPLATDTEIFQESITVFNPLPVSRSAVIRRLLKLPAWIEPSSLTLVDEYGTPVPFVIGAAHRVKRFWGREFPSSPNGAETLEWFERYLIEFPDRFDAQTDGAADDDLWLAIEFQGDLPAVGPRTFRLIARDEDHVVPQIPQQLVTGDGLMENDLVGVTLHPDGRIDLLDKRTNTEYHDLNRLESTEDTGDEYDYAAATDTHTVTTDGLNGNVLVVSDSGLRATLETTYDWLLPRGLANDRNKRAEQVVACPVRVRVSLERESPLVELEVAMANRATDHRVRARFIGPAGAKHLYSDGHFYTNERPLEVVDHPEWVQPPSGTYPQQGFSALESGGFGIAVLNRGLHEVAPIATGDGTPGFAVTLLRAVGWLSRDDLPTRKHKAAGPMVPTPDAQCIGVHRFQLGILPYTGDLSVSGVRNASIEFRVPPLSIQHSAVSDLASPTAHGLVEHSGPGTVVTAIKRHEDRESLIVRLFNDQAKSNEARLSFGRSVAGAWRCSLMEDRLDTVEHRDASVRLVIDPHEIVTLEMAFS